MSTAEAAESGIATVHESFERMRRQLDSVVLGQARMKERVLVCLLAGGHALIEGAPGTAKTLLALALSRLLSCRFRRIQFTPDLMPVDLLGTNIYDQKAQEFVFQPGPVFTDVLLADEVNRTTPRTQSALLEAMQERAVTIDGVRRVLSPVFFVVATQNPVEYEGTYPLPEAQKDRFLLKVEVDYPTSDEELAVLRAYGDGNSLHEDALGRLEPVLDAGSLQRAIETVSRVRVEEKILSYVRDVVATTRKDPGVQLGAGPRGSLALLSAARAQAALRGRAFVTPDDVKELAPAVLAHRVTLAPEAEIEGLDLGALLQRIFERIEVPR